MKEVQTSFEELEQAALEDTQTENENVPVTVEAHGVVATSTDSNPASPIEGAFDKRSAHAQLTSTSKSLGVLHRFLFTHKVSRIRRTEAETIAKKLFSFEREAIEQKMTLALAYEKRATFVEYLRSTVGLAREVQMLDAAYRTHLVDTLMDIDSRVFSMYNAQRKRLQDQHRDGLLSDDHAKRELQKLNKLLDDNLKQSLTTYQAMHDTHVATLEETLSLFQRDLKAKGLL